MQKLLVFVCLLLVLFVGQLEVDAAPKPQFYGPGFYGPGYYPPPVYFGGKFYRVLKSWNWDLGDFPETFKANKIT